MIAVRGIIIAGFSLKNMQSIFYIVYAVDHKIKRKEGGVVFDEGKDDK